MAEQEIFSDARTGDALKRAGVGGIGLEGLQPAFRGFEAGLDRLQGRLRRPSLGPAVSGGGLQGGEALPGADLLEHPVSGHAVRPEPPGVLDGEVLQDLVLGLAPEPNQGLDDTAPAQVPGVRETGGDRRDPARVRSAG